MIVDETLKNEVVPYPAELKMRENFTLMRGNHAFPALYNRRIDRLLYDRRVPTGDGSLRFVVD
jgi:hypothetical protein